MVAVNAQGHQEGSDSVKQVSCQHRPENVTGDTERSSCARMQEASDVGPLTLGRDTETGRLCCRITGGVYRMSNPVMLLPG